MAIKSRVIAQSLVIKLYLGEGKNGKATYKNLTLKGIKQNALDTSIYDVAKALETILPYQVTTISKNTAAEILDEVVQA